LLTIQKLWDDCYEYRNVFQTKSQIFLIPAFGVIGGECAPRLPHYAP